MNYSERSLELHRQWRGKIEVIATVPADSKDALSLAYTPGVAQPCLEIQRDPALSYELTRRHNLCAVITDGSRETPGALLPRDEGDLGRQCSGVPGRTGQARPVGRDRASA